MSSSFMPSRLRILLAHLAQSFLQYMSSNKRLLAGDLRLLNSRHLSKNSQTSIFPLTVPTHEVPAVGNIRVHDCLPAFGGVPQPPL